MGGPKHRKTDEHLIISYKYWYLPVCFGMIAIYLGSVLIIYSKINQIQSVPYLDEIYHIPQAQAYCEGNFSHWDNRITTLPGLYLISISVIYPLSKWVGVPLCETQHLRLTNVILGLFNLCLYIWLTKRIHPNVEARNQFKSLLSAINMSLFPPLFFFNFLYYTDMAAVCLILLMLGLHVCEKKMYSALAGLAAILVRQTSVVWILMLAVGCVENVFNEELLTANDRKQKTASSWHQIIVFFTRFFEPKPLTRWFFILRKLFAALLPCICIGLVFCAFVVINGGIVVGDRTAHEATIHFPQLFYLFGIVVVFGAPHWLNSIGPFCRSCLKRWYLVLIAFGVMGLVIRYNTQVHPYLLADNRHYVFYIWKRIFEYHTFGRYLVMPVYLFGAYVTYQTLIKSRSFLFASAVLICCIASLVPQRLLEIRYFFIPFLLIRMHIPPRSAIPLILEFSMFVCINIAAIYLFINRPFYWADSPLVQRFMW